MIRVSILVLTFVLCSVHGVPKPVFRNECVNPSLNTCSPNANCIDTFYSFTCQCKNGFADNSPNKKDEPGRVCEPGDGAAPTQPAAAREEPKAAGPPAGAQPPASPAPPPTNPKTPPAKEATKTPPEDKSGEDTSEEKSELRDTFNLFDSNKDGQINFSELRDATKKSPLKLTDAQVRDMLKKGDSSRDGQVNFEEYKLLMKGRRA